MYAVIELQGHQYIVSQDTTLVVDQLTTEENESLIIDKVLCVFDEAGATVQVWAPYVAWAQVSAQIVSHQKGEKINVLKFHRKNRYEKNKGFRPYQTTLTITGVTVS